MIRESMHPRPGDHELRTQLTVRVEVFGYRRAAVVGDLVADECIDGRLDPPRQRPHRRM